MQQLIHRSLPAARADQRGMVLISSLLLLLVVTIMALSIFRSFGMQEKIAGNMRDKQRALQAAVSAQQYAEWWIANGSNAPAAVSNGVAAAADINCTALLDANLGVGQLCLNSLLTAAGLQNAAQWPGSGFGVGVQYTPQGFNYTGSNTNPNVQDIYFARPRFYISDMGTTASGRGEVYQVDAYSYGVSSSSVAVVESTVQVSCVVCNVGGL
jgi:type IV pilus assembly protein PilX